MTQESHRRINTILRIPLLPLMSTLLMVPLTCTSLFAQSSIEVKAGVRRVRAWDEMVNTVVEVDGLAWGAASKGLGAHLVLPTGKVYLRDANLLPHDNNGRLLRVAGVLRKAQTAKAPPGVQGYSESFDYFYIETIEAVRIDKVTSGQLLPSNDEWIVEGLPVEKANEMIRARRLRPYGLSVASTTEGARPHCYELGNSQVMVFYELKGRILSIAWVQITGRSKRDLVWKPVSGLRLPPRPARGKAQ